MSEQASPYQVVELSVERRGMAAYQDIKLDVHRMYALLEVDVTLARQFMDDYKAQTGESLSFTGYLIACLAQAVDQDKSIQAYRKGSKQLLLFDDVDVGFMIELKQEGKPILRGHVIRGANRKSYQEIHQEIRAVQSGQMPLSAEKVSWFRSALLMPWPFYNLFKAFFRRTLRNNPTIITSMVGTVGITSVGMFGKDHSGWGISTGSHGLDLVVGSISQKPGIVDGQIVPRQILNLTILFDHDVIDGAPAARFTRRLVELIESGYGLDRNQFINTFGSGSAAVPVV